MRRLITGTCVTVAALVVTAASHGEPTDFVNPATIVSRTSPEVQAFFDGPVTWFPTDASGLPGVDIHTTLDDSVVITGPPSVDAETLIATMPFSYEATLTAREADGTSTGSVHWEGEGLQAIDVDPTHAIYDEASGYILQPFGAHRLLDGQPVAVSTVTSVDGIFEENPPVGEVRQYSSGFLAQRIIPGMELADNLFPNQPFVAMVYTGVVEGQYGEVETVFVNGATIVSRMSPEVTAFVDGPLTWYPTEASGLPGVDASTTLTDSVEISGPPSVDDETLIATLPFDYTGTLTSYDEDGVGIGSTSWTGAGLQAIDVDPSHVIYDEASGYILQRFGAHPLLDGQPVAVSTVTGAAGIFADNPPIGEVRQYSSGFFAQRIIPGMEVADNLFPNQPYVAMVYTGIVEGQYVPEPSTLAALLSLGAAGLLIHVVRRARPYIGTNCQR